MKHIKAAFLSATTIVSCNVFVRQSILLSSLRDLVSKMYFRIKNMERQRAATQNLDKMQQSPGNTFLLSLQFRVCHTRCDDDVFFLFGGIFRGRFTVARG
jgi:hypothetical protein